MNIKSFACPRSYLICAALLLSWSTATNSADGDFEWAVQFGNSDVSRGLGIALDQSGNVYSTGQFRGGPIDFDPGLGVAELTPTGSSLDVYISKLSPNGDFVWAKQIGSVALDVGEAIENDANGNTYIGGRFGGQADFDPGPTEYVITPIIFSSDISNAFIVKLDANGDFVWARAFLISSTADHPVGGSIRVSDIAIDSFGNVYITGSFWGNVDFDPGEQSHFLTAPDFHTDAFIVKLDVNGNFLSAVQFGGDDIDNLFGISIDNSDYLYITGIVRGIADFAGISFDPTVFGAFVAKLDSNLNVIWAHQLVAAFSSGSDIAVDAAGNVYATGRFRGTADFDFGPDIYTLGSVGDSSYVLKLDSAGDFLWAGAFGNFSNGIDVDSHGRMFITGGFSGSKDFDPGPDLLTLTSDGIPDDIFILGLSAAGALEWVHRFGAGGVDRGYDIAVDSHGSAHVTGEFEFTVDFDPGPNVFELAEVAAGDSLAPDAYVLKLVGEHVFDLDGDGVLDINDNCIEIPNPDQTDNDLDGAGDACDTDDDNDNIPDGSDNCPLVANADQLDLDGDGLGDICDGDMDADGVANDADNCPLAANSDQTDTDIDGIGDECDADDDNDGVLDADDNCSRVPNPDQDDLDGDEIGDVCDADLDGDGFLNALDNCPVVPNVGQDDTDFDGDGDACDEDDDNDGVRDTDDNCPLIFNLDQTDSDGDGLGDICDADLDGDGVANEIDNCPSVANSSQSDIDGDAIGDACDPDIDGDGVSNDLDSCAMTPIGDLVDPENGCSIEQLCPCDGPRGTVMPWKNHGKYVSCTAHAANGFLDDGLISEAEKDATVSAAGQSSCGNKK